MLLEVSHVKHTEGLGKASKEVTSELSGEQGNLPGIKSWYRIPAGRNIMRRGWKHKG